MTENALEKEYTDYLNRLPLAALRVLGRLKGIPAQFRSTKPDIVSAVTDILMGRRESVPSSGRGAPVKQNYLDPSILATLDEIRARHEANPENPEKKNKLGVAAPESARGLFDETVYTGILEIMPTGYGFVRARNCQPSNVGDVFIAASLIHSYRLREGDAVACHVKPSSKGDSAAIDTLLSVNGASVGQYEKRPLFDTLTACYPNERISLSEEDGKDALRIIDLFSPIGKGQRALVIAPPKTGKTTLLKEIAQAIAARHPELHLILLLIDERPEEVTDLRTSVERAEVIYSTFDETADHHIRAAELTIAHAKRLAEMGKDVVVLLDSLTKLTRAYNYVCDSSGKTLSGGLDAGAFIEPKRFFGAARNIEGGGSLTILATALTETGSRMDDIIYEEFKGTGNSDIFLSRELAERRIFPAIDVRRSGTRREEMLLPADELAAVRKLRERGLVNNTEGLLEMLHKTKGNAEFVSRLNEWLKLYKNI